MDNKDKFASAPDDLALKFLRPVLATTLTLGSLAWASDSFRKVGLVLFTEQFLSAMLALALALVFIHYPARRGAERRIVPWYDLLLGLAGFSAGAYVAIVFPNLTERLADAPLDGIIVAFIFFFLSIEGLRRSTGYALVAIVLFFVFYALLGHLVPGDLETRKVGLIPLVNYLSLDTNALMGLPLVIATTIVITFVFFGQLLLRSGGADFFNDISMALMGRYRGGSAKIAITASSLFGSVSGVAVSNIVATGIITIPMMKRAGYPARMAAAIEAVASTGGQLMPPVMGAVAFLMADFLQRPYQDIVIAALVPSLLYYVSLFMQADLEAAKDKISPVDASVIPQASRVLAAGWMFLLPFAALIYALFWLNWEAETAALLASVVVLAIGIIFGHKGQRISLHEIWYALQDTGTSVLDIIMIVTGAGFIIGVLQVTGLGFAFTLFVVDFGNSNLVAMLAITAALCILLGMGMPTIGVYILLAVLLAPSLVEVGIDPLAAHMFILYLGMMSLITPPVAIAAFFAASIAKAPPMATGWTSMRFGWTAYVVPFLFVFSPSLLLQGNAFDLVVDVVTALAGVWLISACLIGYFCRPMAIVTRLGYFVLGAMLMIPNEITSYMIWINAAGAALGIALVAWDIASAKKTTRPHQSDNRKRIFTI